MSETTLVDQSPVPFDPQDDEHRVALARTGRFGAQAAGGVVLAAGTGRFLLMLRSEDVLESGTYGNCGGAHKRTERPIDAARREIGEETGWSGPDAGMMLIPALVYREPEFTYSNFIAVVSDEFEPIYGWEAVGHVWCTTGDLPSPLHFGIEALLKDPESRAILEGGWRRHAETAPASTTDDDTTSNPFSIENPSSIAPGAIDGRTLPRPLSEKTVARIANGVASILERQSRMTEFAMDALGLDRTMTTNVTVEPPFEMRSIPAGTGGTTLVPPAFDPKEGFVIMFSDNEPNGRIIEAAGAPVAPPREHEFTIVLQGDDLPSENVVDAIYEAGCSDALIAFQNGELQVDFVREAHTIRQAVSEALRQLRSAGTTPSEVRSHEPGQAVELEGVLED